MRKILIALAAVAGLVFTGAVASAAQVDPDTYKRLGDSSNPGTYGESEGWFKDSSDNMYLYVNDSSTLTISSAGVITTAGALDVAGGTITMANDAVLSNATNNAVSLTENSEDIVLTFGTDDIAVTSSTGVTEIDFGTINIETDEIDANGTGTLTFLVNGEDVVVTGGTNSWALSSTTGVVALDFAAVGTTLTFANDQTINTGTDNAFIFGDNSEDLSITFGTNLATFNSSTGATLAFTPAVSFSDFDTAVILQGDAPATCTLGQWFLDTATTKELCYCQAANTFYCISFTTTSGPTD